MLSYQHIYHAGNPADIHKHFWLLTVLEYLLRKDKPVCWIDTHAGRGLYDLTAPEAQKTAEYKTGFMPIYEALKNDAALPAPLRLYFDCVEMLNHGGPTTRLPGSSLLAAGMLRPGDRLLAYEKHKGEFPHLVETLKPYALARAHHADGYQGLMEALPPPERRGGALIDPSYEIKSEYADIPAHLKSVLALWPSGIFMIWYPLLPAGQHTILTEGCRMLGPETLIDEWIWRAPEQGRGMYGSGMVVINPPYTTPGTMTHLKDYSLKHIKKLFLNKKH